MVLSHTWGRFRKKKDGGKISCHVDGVPWPVPEIELFSVQDLPERFLKIATGRIHLRYLWIDLFCIPQDQASPEFKKIEVREIGRQASIFSMALVKVARLNEIESWQNLKEAIHWLLFSYIARHAPSGTDYVP